MPKPAARLRDERTHAAETHHADRLAGELDPLPLRALPATADFSAAWACGMFRACARSRAKVCSAAEMMLDCGALTTMTPAPGGRLDVDVVQPDAGPRHHLSRRRPPSTSAVTWVASGR